MRDLLDYSLDDGIATIRLDDGKRNVMSPAMLRQINAALDRAESDRATVIFTGREQVFSAGFDLKVMQGAPKAAIGMLRAGYSLTARVLAYPYPVIVACNGHSLAMGVFLMLSADYVIGTRGDFRIAASEVAIGLTMPRVAALVLRNRLTPAAFQTAVTLARDFPVDEAQAVGFFDELSDAGDLMPRARELATGAAELDMAAHKASKRRIRRKLIRRIRIGVWLDLLDAVRIGVRRARGRKHGA